jgi:type III secretion system YscQ/HrcQ family protein
VGPLFPDPTRSSHEAWHSRLARLPPPLPEQLTQLFAAGARFDVALPDGHCEIALGQSTDASVHDLVELRAAACWLALGGLNDSGWREAPPWRELGGVSRLLGWTLAHERIVLTLGTALGTTLEPAWLHPRVDAVARREGGIVLSIRLRFDDGEQIDGQSWWTPAALGALLARDWPRQRVAASDWAALSLACRVERDGPPLRAAQVAALRRNDVIVLGTRAAVQSHLRLRIGVSGHCIDFALHGAIARAIGVSSHHAPNIASTRGTRTMHEQASTTNAAPGIALDAVPVEVSFELAVIEKTIAELRELTPGASFALPLGLDGAGVLIRVNGRVVGRGDLVAAGDNLGVRIVEIDPRTV